MRQTEKGEEGAVIWLSEEAGLGLQKARGCARARVRVRVLACVREVCVRVVCMCAVRTGCWL